MNRSLWLMFAVFFFIVTCSSRPAKDQSPDSSVGSSADTRSVSSESQHLASRQETRFVTEVNFPKGKHFVREEAAQDLQRIYQTAHKSGRIDRVQLITWADEEYPGKKKVELSKEQTELVTDRNEALSKILRSQNSKLKVETYSMAQRPLAFKKILPTEENKIETSLESSGIPHSDDTMRAPGKASKSIVIFIMEE